ncbi:MAG: bifunctional alpha,alpha-trehalose-phosphate synthase (UDP-forming)/trehalose-phosphatase [Bacteroidales bacterium]|nr:bifunctional alpha,alpha-trehalose-phosphate synthase (UDP-forming)/trehalose-phosphatase [Bacteroidales bacterium]MBN2634182.1 bifunctional alpha,alpha-trehalose-phosphate synthase (UDP-forming)/trehalose-phosphatase [Bacteroidales bacterium]
MKTIDNLDFKRIIIVAYRLPFSLVKKKGEYQAVQNAGGLVSAILSLSQKMKPSDDGSAKIVWIGTGDQRLENISVSAAVELHPVDIPKKVNDKYYAGFCNDTIWPLFHYFVSGTVFDNSYFDAYVTANELFFQKVKEILKPGDFVWVHDYQLFLLPGLIRKAYPDSDMGFFLHIPFPSFEMFRLLPRKWREAILTGITGADVVGFHINDYTQYFIKSVKRTLGYSYDRNFISINYRICKADAFPIGIDFNKFHEACFTPKTNNSKKKIKKYLGDKKLIFSVDRLDYTKGLLVRLQAYERFLELFPEWHYKVVFNMVVVPSRDMIREYRELKKEIEATTGRINGKYSTLDWRPLIYQYRSIPFHEMIAIYNLSDVGLITPLRDGMNLVAKEYIACQQGRYGMLVLSEMTGAATELNEAIIINPTDVEETADALNKALIMPEEEKEKRVLKMQNRLRRYDVFTWTKDFLNQVNEVKEEKRKLKVNYLNNDTLAKIRDKYQKTSKRLFLIDYDGTLTPIVSIPEMALLNEETGEILRKIASDPFNKLVIISGRSGEFLETQFRDIDATLVAEHGYLFRNPGKEWEQLQDIDLSWKSKFIPLLEDYVDRCSGSMIEDKHASLVWHYRNADEDIAQLRINELRDDISELLKNDPRLQVLEGDKVVEIKSLLYDKGIMANRIISEDNYDFIIAIGDDRTDEDLFKAVADRGFTIKIGCKPTHASFNLKDQSQILGILRLFTNS